MSLWNGAKRWGLRLLVASMICGLTVNGCAHSANCKTACGFKAEDVPDGWTCQDVQDVETAIMRELQLTKDDRIKVCNLKGFQLVVVDAPSWMSFKREVAGLTYCENGNVVIGNSPPNESALAHEFVHALQKCYPLGPYEDDFYHSNWGRDGIYAAIDRATASLDAGR